MNQFYMVLQYLHERKFDDLKPLKNIIINLLNQKKA